MTRLLIVCLLAAASLSAAQAKQTFTGTITDNMCARADHSQMQMGPTDAVVEKAPVDDVLYILDGEITIEADDKKETYHAGDFAYLFAGARQRYTVTDHVKLIYICYPRDWKIE